MTRLKVLSTTTMFALLACLAGFIAAGCARTLGVQETRAAAPSAAATNLKTAGPWIKYEGNPVLGGQYGTCFDISVLGEGQAYRMWVSWRPRASVALVESKDGLHWEGPPKIVLGPQRQPGWESDINRPVVIKKGDGYQMWYTGQARGRSAIGFTTSEMA